MGVGSLFLSVPQIAAAAAPAPQAGNPMAFLFSMVIIFGIFYLLIIRPQQKKQNELKRQLEGVKKGDKIVTSGGIIGTVAAIKDENTVVVKISDNVRVDVVRGYISGILNSESAPEEKK